MKQLAALVVFLFAWGVYVATCPPTIQAGDSGELVAAAATVGIAHPPGYPLLAMVWKVGMTLVPFGTLAFRAALCSALAAALTCWIVAYWIRCVEPHAAVSALVIGLTVAWGKTFWGEAVEAEAYALNAALGLGVGFAVWRGRMLMAWVLYGCALANHHSFLIVAPILAWVSVVRQPLPLKAGQVAMWVGCVGLGLTWYLWLPLRSSTDLLVDWGHPDSFQGMLAHVLRKQYGTLTRQARSWPLLAEQCKAVIRFVAHEHGWMGIAAAALGAAVWWWRQWAWRGTHLILWVTLTMGVTLLLNFGLTDELIEVVEVFFVPAHVLTAAWMSAGILWLGRRHPWMPWVALVMPAWLFSAHWHVNNRSRNAIAHDYGMNMLRVMNRDAVLLTKGDNQMFPLAYLRYAEGHRRDVAIYDDYAYLFGGAYGDDFSSLSDDGQAERRTQVSRQLLGSGSPVFFTAASYVSLLPEVEEEPCGVIYRGSVGSLRPEAERTHEDAMAWRRVYSAQEHSRPFHETYLASNMTAQYHYFRGKRDVQRGRLGSAMAAFQRATMTGYSMESMYNNVAVELYKLDQYEQAIVVLERARTVNPLKPEIHWNIGTVRLIQGHYPDAIRAYEEALQLRPAYTDAYAKMGETYVKMGRMPEARQYLAEALRLRPNHPDALTWWKQLPRE